MLAPGGIDLLQGCQGIDCILFPVPSVTPCVGPAAAVMGFFFLCAFWAIRYDQNIEIPNPSPI